MNQALAAHLRLMESGGLKVRTHEAKPQRQLPPHMQKGHVMAKSAQGKRRPVVLFGKRYPSVEHAMKGAKIGATRLYRLIERGIARYDD